jgi:hypothetical protein
VELVGLVAHIARASYPSRVAAIKAPQDDHSDYV